MCVSSHFAAIYLAYVHLDDFAATLLENKNYPSESQPLHQISLRLRVTKRKKAHTEHKICDDIHPSFQPQPADVVFFLLVRPCLVRAIQLSPVSSPYHPAIIITCINRPRDSCSLNSIIRRSGTGHQSWSYRLSIVLMHRV